VLAIEARKKQSREEKRNEARYLETREVSEARMQERKAGEAKEARGKRGKRSKWGIVDKKGQRNSSGKSQEKRDRWTCFSGSQSTPNRMRCLPSPITNSPARGTGTCAQHHNINSSLKVPDRYV
jgi:hypothetical protein